MSPSVELVRHASLHLRPDPSRVIARPFLPGQEVLSPGISRAEGVIARVGALSDAEVEEALAAAIASFSDRHHDLLALFRAHFALVASRVPVGTVLSPARANLLGAYFTQEYTLEGAAIFNPSIVPDPVQDGAGSGQMRFIMSVRAVGEGHLSTIEFRQGLFGPGDQVRIEPAAAPLTTGAAVPAPVTLASIRSALGVRHDMREVQGVLGRLPAAFTASQLDDVLDLDGDHSVDPTARAGLIDDIRRLAARSYDVTYPLDSLLSERVLHPLSAAESRGLEDARFTRFEDHDGGVTHYATYTAFDGARIAPHLIQTDDFRTFRVRPLTGAAAANKGMALFPRRIHDQFWAVSRWDRENLSVAHSADVLHWQSPVVVQRPSHHWDLIQIGTCASPLETSQGWLVITHGVGPLRTYSIGAMLLDLDDPTTVLAVLDQPLMTVELGDRNGYVPNVVYSCGALLHDRTILLPYGCSDATIRFAFIDLPGLLQRLAGKHHQAPRQLASSP